MSCTSIWINDTYKQNAEHYNLTNNNSNKNSADNITIYYTFKHLYPHNKNFDRTLEIKHIKNKIVKWKYVKFLIERQLNFYTKKSKCFSYSCIYAVLCKDFHSKLYLSDDYIFSNSIYYLILERRPNFNVQIHNEFKFSFNHPTCRICKNKRINDSQELIPGCNTCYLCNNNQSKFDGQLTKVQKELNKHRDLLLNQSIYQKYGVKMNSLNNDEKKFYYIRFEQDFGTFKATNHRSRSRSRSTNKSIYMQIKNNIQNIVSNNHKNPEQDTRTIFDEYRVGKYSLDMTKVFTRNSCNSCKICTICKYNNKHTRIFQKKTLPFKSFRKMKSQHYHDNVLICDSKYDLQNDESILNHYVHAMSEYFELNNPRILKNKYGHIEKKVQ